MRLGLTWVGVLLLLPSLLSPQAREATYLTFVARQSNDIYVRDLRRDEVLLEIDGERVEVRYLGFQDVDCATAILIENSPRTAQYAVSSPHRGQINTVDRVRFGLMEGILGQWTTLGPVLLAEFREEFTVLQDFTEIEDNLVLALNRMKPKVAFIDFDQIQIGRMLGRAVDLLRERPERRKVLVLFTTTIDRETINNLDEYRAMFRYAGIDLYIVSFAPRFTSGTLYSAEEKSNFPSLSKLVGETSGKLYLSGEHVFVSEFMEDLAARLTNTYTIGFYVQPREEPTEHSVKVEVERPKIRVSSRETLVF